MGLHAYNNLENLVTRSTCIETILGWMIFMEVYFPKFRPLSRRFKRRMMKIIKDMLRLWIMKPLICKMMNSSRTCWDCEQWKPSPEKKNEKWKMVKFIKNLLGLWTTKPQSLHGCELLIKNWNSNAYMKLLECYHGCELSRI